MKSIVAAGLGILVGWGWASPLLAQDEEPPQPPIPFEGGTLTITPTDDLDKVLAYDGKELARDYVVYFDRIVELGGTKVALFAVGDGGNQCGPAELIVWKPQGGDIQTETVGEDCGAPPAAVTGESIYFVPYLIPGESDTVMVWSPEGGLEVAGKLTYEPQPGTDWTDFDPSRLENIVDALKNEAVYETSQKLLGDQLTGVVTGLLTGGGTDTTASGILYASGCVPHACGTADAFMGVDAPHRRVYFAQQGENPAPAAWPALDTWPADLRQAMQAALGRQ